MSEEKKAGTPAQGKKEVANQNATEVKNSDVNTTSTVINHKNSIEALQATLEEQLRKLSYKNEIANNRIKFLNTKTELEKAKSMLKKEVMFESELVTLTFKSRTNNTNYASDLFSISERDLLIKFIDILDCEIDAKILEIETKLMEG